MKKLLLLSLVMMLLMLCGSGCGIFGSKRDVVLVKEGLAVQLIKPVHARVAVPTGPEGKNMVLADMWLPVGAWIMTIEEE